jgi:hypothetical protein
MRFTPSARMASGYAARCILLLAAAIGSATLHLSSRADAPQNQKGPSMNNPATALLSTANEPFPVIEFRRYTIKPGQRKVFSQYFEAFFPEAFQQLGAMAFGEFYEREHDNGFTWFRGFPSMEARAIDNSAFYYGPVWKEHRNTLNALIDDSDNVILMRPMAGYRGMPVLPAVDPVLEPGGAHGIVIAQLFAMKADASKSDANKLDSDFAAQADKVFARYREAGIKEIAVLASLNANNNFPQLPIRTDGPYVLWLGMVEDQRMLETAWAPLAQQAQLALADSGLLRQAPETIIMDPAPRSRLRWQVR